MKLSTACLWLTLTSAYCVAQAADDVTRSATQAAVPIVIAHRGASGYRPEHTLEAYRFAILQGADFIELDLVVTRDGELIVRHENLLADVELDAAGNLLFTAQGEPLVKQATTDVAEHPEFRSRLTVKEVDGRLQGGWFSEDFTLAEIKTLWARERMPELRPLNRLYDDTLRIPTLQEVIALVRAQTEAGEDGVGLYIELKHPTYYLYAGHYQDGQPINFDLGQALLDALSAENFLAPTDLYIQSFEVDSLLRLQQQLAERSLQWPLVQLFGDISNLNYRAQPYDMVYHAGQDEDLLKRYGDLQTLISGGITTNISYAELATPAVVAYMAATFAAGIGPAKQNLLLTRVGEAEDPDGDGAALQRAVLTGEVGPLMAAARAAGLEVHPYTLRAEEPFLVRDANGVVPVAAEGLLLLQAGATGLFADQPMEGRAAVAAYRQQQAAAASQSPSAAQPVP